MPKQPAIEHGSYRGTYKGFDICRWSGPGRFPAEGPEYKWYVQTQHTPTGVDNSPELCPKFWTLKAARGWIDNQLRKI